jgi:hypothetical protein
VSIFIRTDLHGCSLEYCMERGTLGTKFSIGGDSNVSYVSESTHKLHITCLLKTCRFNKNPK